MGRATSRIVSMRAAFAIMMLGVSGCGGHKTELAVAASPSRWSWSAEEVEAEMVKALDRVQADLRSPRLMATFYVMDQSDATALENAARMMPNTDVALLAPGVDSLVPTGFTAIVHERASLWHVRLTSAFVPSDRAQVRSWVRQLWTLAPEPRRTLGSFGVIDAAR